MRAVVQRVRRAAVRVDGRLVGGCGPGFLVYLGVCKGDTDAEAGFLADRVAGLRVMPDSEGKMNLSLAAYGEAHPGAEPGVLAVSNFTLYADTSQRRPNFAAAAPYEDGRRLFDLFVASLRGRGLAVATGEYGADMEVEALADGPVTLVIESPPAV
jgi:D-tyrosyl-tRNA(Tyr) deacylase